MELEQKSKIKVTTLCSASFVIISYLIFRTDLPKFLNLFLYNFIIVISLQSLGFYRGLFFLSSSIFLTIILSLANGFYYIWNVPGFFLFFLIVNGQIKKLNYYSHIIEERIEDLREKTNVLKNEYEQHRKSADFLERRKHRYRSLKDIVSILNSAFSLEEVIGCIIDSALRVIGKTDALFLFLVDIEKKKLNLVASRPEKNLDRGTPEKLDLLDEWVFKEEQCLLVEDIKKDIRFSTEILEKYSNSFRSVISAPLIADRKIIGILRLEHSKPYNYTSEDLKLLALLCDLGAVSIQKVRLYKKMLGLRIRDSLTGFYLRGYFLDKMKEEISRSLQNSLNCSFLILDIDNFKDYNDKFGYSAGDMAIKTISKIVEKVIPDNVILARYGGEEFSILLPEVSKDEAKILGDAVRKAIKKEPIEFRREKTYVTVSIAVANFPEDAKAEDELLLKADERLYIAKRQGRDRVVAG